MMRSLFIFFAVFLCLPGLHSQNLNGTWEGMIDDGEKLQVNIMMKKTELCGYSWDYDVNNPASHCKAIFKGWYDPEQDIWILMGTSFMENSGNHILMLVRLWHAAGDPKNTLRGTVESKSGALSLLNMGGGRDRVQLRRVSPVAPKDMPDCFSKIIRPKTSAGKKEATIKPLPKNIKPGTIKKTAQQPLAVKAASASRVPSKPKPAIPGKQLSRTTDTLKITPSDISKKITTAINVPPAIQNDNASMVQKMNARKKTALSHIIVNEKSITLSIYDNGTVDNDTVSVFYNGRLIADKKGLSEKPVIIHLELDEKAALHEIVMYAENLGSLPPNTALIVVTAGDKRYELHSSASLTENAVLTFEYRPK